MVHNIRCDNTTFDEEVYHHRAYPNSSSPTSTMMDDDAPVFDDGCPNHPTMHSSAGATDMNGGGTSRVVSIPCDDAQFADEPLYVDEPAPGVVSCNSSCDESIMGCRFGNINYKYHINPQVLGSGLHGSVRRVYQPLHRRAMCSQDNLQDRSMCQAGRVSLVKYLY